MRDTDEKQKLIINVAKSFFDKKGPQFTSIEDIVKECKISKTTFYKYFSTKEELMAEMWRYLNNIFLENLKASERNDEITPREKFKRKIIFMWKYISSTSSFKDYVIEKFPEVKGNFTINIKDEIRSSIVESYKESLINIYGEKIEEKLWELVFLLDGILHEFILITRIYEREFSDDFVGEYSIRSLDIWIEGLKSSDILINKETFYGEGVKEEEGFQSKQKKLFFEEIEKLKKLIRGNYALDEQSRLMQAIDNIEKEAKSEGYDSLIMDAMICFLEKEDVLKNEAILLSKLKSKIGGV